jgi:stage II sporulation protein AA (anti-sigma F factor antagonist)
VALIRCQGRIVVGKEVELLQQEVEKHRLETQKYVLQLAEVIYLDSGGLGALVRLVGMLRAQRGDLKLCEVSPFVQSVLKATNLLPVFSIYPTEREALASFARGPSPREAHSWTANTKVLCVDPSSDLLAYMSAILKPAGFEVKSTRYLADAATLLTATKPRAVICGPGVQSATLAFEKFRCLDPHIPFLQLPSDFHAAAAFEAGFDLISRLKSLLQT